MGSSGKGGSSTPQYTSQDAFNYGYGLKAGNARMDGLAGIDPNMTGYDQIYAGYMQAHNEKVRMERFKSMMNGQAESSANAYASALAAQREAEAEAEERMRIDRRDSAISGYYDAANTATSFVSDKMAAEAANAALMGVDYSVGDEAKQERIANYFSSLWSEGDQTNLEQSFEGVGPGDFEQTLFRGTGVEGSGPGGQIGSEQAGGGITPKPAVKKTLMDDENILSAGTTALGA